MHKRPELERLAEQAKDALMAALWAEVQRLKARLAALEAKPHEPRKDAHNSSVTPSHSRRRTSHQAHVRERAARPVWDVLVVAGRGTRPRTTSSSPRPRPVRIVGV